MSYGTPYQQNKVKSFSSKLWGDVKDIYFQNGYTEELEFDNYLFLFNPNTCESVRLYYNGKIIEK